MLTSSRQKAKFDPPMRRTTVSIPLLILTLLLLQACYTVVTPPDTLPETVTQVIPGPVYVSSVGAPGVYGWDPYWEPTVPYYSYYGGYTAAYYSPYYYYDYHHPYYAPVYGGYGGYGGDGGTSPEPAAGRSFDRDESLGSGRDRQPNAGTTSTSGSKPSGNNSAGGMSSVAPIAPQPVVVAPPPVKQIDPPTIRGSRRTREVKPEPSGKVGSTKQVQETSSSSKTSEDKPAKRIRTRK